MAVAFAGAALATLVAASLALRRVVVEGESMRPGLEPGDRLLVARLPTRVRLHPGAVVAAADPRAPGRLLVKRVARVEGDRVVLHGDNPHASTDSRTFGPVARRSVWGVAWYRYAPPERAGRLHPGTAAPGARRRATGRARTYTAPATRAGGGPPRGK